MRTLYFMCWFVTALAGLFLPLCSLPFVHWQYRAIALLAPNVWRAHYHHIFDALVCAIHWRDVSARLLVPYLSCLVSYSNWLELGTDICIHCSDIQLVLISISSTTLQWIFQEEHAYACTENPELFWASRRWIMLPCGEWVHAALSRSCPCC